MITKPLTLIGKPGTILELTAGPIVIDFNADPGIQLEEPLRASRTSLFSLSRHPQKPSYPPGSPSGQDYKLKRSEVVMI